MKPLAHSACPNKGIKAQSYEEHIIGVLNRTRMNVEEMLKYCTLDSKVNLIDIVVWAAYYHDLGKLDIENQEVLSGIKKARHLPVNHVDAGVACLKDIEKKLESALLVLSHHRGIPSIPEELTRQYKFRDLEIMERTNENLSYYLDIHKKEVKIILNTVKQSAVPDGLLRRLCLSCLVDADYGDTGHCKKHIYQTRWGDRLKKLDAYVKNAYEENEKSPRNELRNKIYYACRDRSIENSVYFCDSPVGTGKTTAIMAHMLKVAIKRDLRHIIIILPFTNIITQSVETYRKALVLEGEDPETVVAEHDHQADFSSLEARELATLWNAPIIVTTAVQFFETLANNRPSNIRKLHELPGSGIFIDESHAAMPTWLWPQAWLWLEKLIMNWNCHLILASGTSVKFWEIENFIKHKIPIPELLPRKLRNEAEFYEQKRVNLKLTSNDIDKIRTFRELNDFIEFVMNKKGPRIIILNTIYSTAYLAKYMRDKGYDVLHLSTALTPKDRVPIIEEVYRRLKRDKITNELIYKTNWTLVATSCAEAGLNFSFRNGFAELRSVQSFLQINGRVSRDGEYCDSEMWCFNLEDPNIKQHPGFKISQKVFKQIIEDGLIKKLTITELVTETIKRELKEDCNDKGDRIQVYEKTHQYPKVAEECKIINTDTRLVVIGKEILEMLENGKKISSSDLIKNSVQIWADQISKLGLDLIKGHREIYCWFKDGYDPEFLGYMKYLLETEGKKKSDMEVIII
mgnify:CR=1 FL=1